MSSGRAWIAAAALALSGSGFELALLVPVFIVPRRLRRRRSAERAQDPAAADTPSAGSATHPA